MFRPRGIGAQLAAVLAAQDGLNGRRQKLTGPALWTAEREEGGGLFVGLETGEGGRRGFWVPSVQVGC